MKEEKIIKPANGYLMLFILITLLFGSIASISSSITINVMPNPKIEVKIRGKKIDFEGFSITFLVIQNLIEYSLFFEVNEDSSLFDK